MQIKQKIRMGIPAIFVTVSILICDGLFLHNLWRFLQFEPQFSKIFTQISDAKLQMPWLMAVILAAAFWLLFWLGNQKKWRVANVVCGIFLWLLGFVAVTLLTKVNGIRFGDVLFSLLAVLGKGGL